MDNYVKNQLIVALDVATAEAARELVKILRGTVAMFKVGPQLFTVAGPDIVREIVGVGERVFLDLKFHDIPNTVAAAAVEAVRLRVSMFNVHAAGGGEMMRRTAKAIADVAEAEGLNRPSALAVTVLTSAIPNTLSETGISRSLQEQVQALSSLAEASGMDGVVTSPREIALIRTTVKRPGFLIVTPGVRPPGSPVDDQQRVMTAAEAIARGADYIVVGRPITNAQDPLKAAEGIFTEMSRSCC